MSPLNSISSLVYRNARMSRSKLRRTRPRWVRPTLEVLEHRLAPATLIVNSILDNTQADAFLTLREAMLLVDNNGNASAALGRSLTAGEAGQITGSFGSNDAIHFDPALNGQTIALGSALPQITADLNLTGPGPSHLAVNGNSSVQVFSIASGVTAQIAGLTIELGQAVTGGGIANAGTLTVISSILNRNSASNFGGGIFNDVLATLTVSNSTLSGNSAFEGGGIDNRGTLVLMGSDLTNNAASYGGGISNGLGSLTLTNSTLSGNTAVSAGGISNYGYAPLTLTDSTLSGNSASLYGGGIVNRGAPMTLTGSALSGNTASYGGGIADFGGGSVTNGTLSGNSATNGGGIYISLGTLSVSNVRIAKNQASFGAGIFDGFFGNATVTDSTLDGNAASGDGGGISNPNQSTLTLTSSTLSGNSANYGGGIYNQGTAGVINSTLYSNLAQFDGGGIRNFGTLSVTNATISHNYAVFGGGAGISSPPTLTLANSIVSGNKGFGGCPDVDGQVVAISSLIGDPDCTIFEPGSASYITFQDPLLGPLQNNGGPTMTMALLPGSPAIDAGNNLLAVDANGNPLTSDQRGTPFVRISGASVDIGAYEAQPSPVSVGLVPSPSVANFGQVATFTATVSGLVPAFGTPTGSVDFFDTTTTTDLGRVSLSGGQAALSTTRLPVGTQTITASYSGDANFLAGSGTATVNILASIYVLSPNAGAALGLTGTGSINIPGLVQVDSSSPLALAARGNAQVQADSIQVVGGFLTQDQATFSPRPVTGAASVPDPLAGLAAPPPSVGQPSVNLTSGSLTINPGMYIQIKVSGTGILTLNPGIYIITGGGFTVTQNAGVSGTGVLIYNAGSNFGGSGTSLGGISLTGQGGISLTPASTGPYAGIVIFQSPDNPRAISLSARAALGLQNSIIYAPSALLTVNGNALIESALVANRLQVGVIGDSSLTTEGSSNSIEVAAGEVVAANAGPWSPSGGNWSTSFERPPAAENRWVNVVVNAHTWALPVRRSPLEELSRASTFTPKKSDHSKLVDELFARSGQDGPLFNCTGPTLATVLSDV